MPHFLALSRELRDLIYIFLLNASDDPPPSSPADNGERQQLCDKDFRSCKMEFPQTIHIPKTIHISRTALLLTTRQIHDEFAACIAWLKKSGRLQVRYKLDCMLYREESVHPTWLSIPVLSKRVDVLEVDIRLFRDWEGVAQGLMSAWKRDHYGHPSMIFCLWALLERFLTRGPDFLSCEKDGHRMMVFSLVVNVVDTSVPDADRIGIMRSDNVVWEIQQAMEKLLLTYFPRVIKRVGTVVLRDNGRECQRWILTAVPARLNP